ncbi:MAG: tetratricopeptide repeat protein, partial [Candidatus Hodarchaeota archaeon]
SDYLDYWQKESLLRETVQTMKTLKTLYEAGKYREVLNRLAQKEDQDELASLTEDKQIERIYYKSRALGSLGQYEEALQVATVARTNFLSPNDKSLLLALIDAQLYALSCLGRLGEGLEVSVEGDAIIKTLTVKERQTGAVWLALFSHIKGNIYFIKGDLNRALEYHQHSLTIREKINDLSAIAGSLNNIGVIYRAKGELDTALKFYQRSLTVYETIGNSETIARSLNNIGLIYYYKGDLDTALGFYQQSLALKETIGNPSAIALALSNIGNVYRDKGDLDTALGFYQQSLALREEVKNDIFICVILFDLILLVLNQQDSTQALKYLTQLKNIYEFTSNKQVYLRSRLAEALILKQSKRMKHKIQAQMLLEQIVTEEVIDSNLSVLAMVHLCDLLLFEVKSVDDPEVWIEAKALIQQLYAQAQDQQSFPMIVKALLLWAKFAIIEGKFQQALKYYNQARLTAEEKSLGLLVQKVDDEQKSFEAEFEKWQVLIQQNASLQDRLAHAQLKDYLKEAQRIGLI